MSTKHTAEALANMSVGALATLYRQHAETLGENFPSRFPDKQTGVRRVLDIQQRLPMETPVQLKPRKRRGPYFVFKPNDVQRLPKEGSMRQVAFDLMRRPEGASLREIMDAYNARECWDLSDPTTENYRKMKRRAYEGVRLMHYAHGFGLRFVGGAPMSEEALLKNETMPVCCYTKAEEPDARAVA